MKLTLAYMVTFGLVGYAIFIGLASRARAPPNRGARTSPIMALSLSVLLAELARAARFFGGIPVQTPDGSRPSAKKRVPKSHGLNQGAVIPSG